MSMPALLHRYAEGLSSIAHVHKIQPAIGHRADFARHKVEHNFGRAEPIVAGAQVIDSLFRQWNLTPPLEADTIHMAEYFWYLNHAKARRELGFVPRDPADTLNDTVSYVKQNFLGGK